MTDSVTSGVVCVHIPQFPAWAIAQATQVRHPIAVVQGGRVISATRSALQSTVRIGMAADRVRDIASRAVVYLRDVSCERAMWDYALERLHHLTPFLESNEQGVAYLSKPNVAELKALVDDFKACAGVAPSRKIARIAAARAAHGNILLFPKRKVTGFFKATSVDILTNLGFDEEVAERLHLFGYSTLNRAATLSKRHLEAQFGNVVGEELFAYLNPSRERSVRLFHPPKAATATYFPEWDEDLRYEKRFDAVTKHLVEEAHEKLHGWCCRRLVVRVHDGKSEYAVSRVLPKSTDRLLYLLRQIRTLLRPELEGKSLLNSIRVEFRSFSVGENRQGSLWRSRPTLKDAARKVEPRFPGACTRSVHVPFALLPEDEYYYEPYVVLEEDER